ncbi:hypothetical protein [Pseudomonas sp. FP833]|uniref:hypothetical protein n=1 Tax=Pseudomonas sp. FP833 TaxID=2954102 RepID=UPI00273361C1|nr:hypothetical protein [Pseudomonas sp. FP833]WLI54500.1 hypothetical protein PSH63_22885 [Pseudomonas sp. FP833]
MSAEKKFITRWSRDFQGNLHEDPNGSWVLAADAAIRDKRLTEKIDALQALLTAADERADVLETALKKISARCVAYIEAEREMPESSVEVCQMIASAALKPAEAGADSCEFCKGWGFRANPDGADEGCGACNGTGKEPSDDQP